MKISFWHIVGETVILFPSAVALVRGLARRASADLGFALEAFKGLLSLRLSKAKQICSKV